MSKVGPSKDDYITSLNYRLDGSKTLPLRRQENFVVMQPSLTACRKEGQLAAHTAKKRMVILTLLWYRLSQLQALNHNATYCSHTTI